MPDVIKTQEELLDRVRTIVDKEVAERMEASQAEGKAKLDNPHAAALKAQAEKDAAEQKKIDEAGNLQSYLQESKNKEQRLKKSFAYIKCLAAARGDIGLAVDMAAKRGDKHIAAMVKAMGEGTIAGGGALVPEGYANEVIEYLHTLSVMSKMGVTEMPMPYGNLRIPRVSGGATVTWAGENQNVSDTSLTMQDLNLNEKKLIGIVPVSNELLSHSSPKADQVIQNDLSGALAAAMDLAEIRGTGTNFQPKGMATLVQSSNKFNATTAGTIATLAEITGDSTKAMRLLFEGNIRGTRAGWLVSIKSYMALMAAQTTTGAFAFREELANGTFFGFPIEKSNNIPSNLGTGSNESEVYFADFAELMHGVGDQMSISVHDGGAYYNGSAVVSGLSQDQTTIKARVGMDFGARQDGNEIVLIEDVIWGK
jgi:HK97 family phage major capsid protein